MNKLKPSTTKKLGYIWAYMIIFACYLLITLGFLKHDYYSVFGGLCLFNFAFSLLILTDFYSHCHGFKVWRDDVIKEDENESNY